MPEDKYAPKAGDDVAKVHHLHRQLIKDQQATNKKARDEAHKPKAVPAKHEAPGGAVTNPTQPPTSDQPQNPAAPQNQPVDQTPQPSGAEVVSVNAPATAPQ